MSKSGAAVASPQELIGKGANSNGRYAALESQTSETGSNDPLSTTVGSVRSIEMKLDKKELSSICDGGLVAKIKLIDNKLIQVPVTAGMKALELKQSVLEESKAPPETTVKLIYQGQFLSDDRKIETLNLKLNPYFHATLSQPQQIDPPQPQPQADEDVQDLEAQQMVNYLQRLSELEMRFQQRQLDFASNVAEVRRLGSARSSISRRPALPSLLVAPRTFPMMSQRARMAQEGNILDLFCGFVFGFIFGVLFVLIAILMCRVKKMYKNGLFLGLIFKVVYFIMFQDPAQTYGAAQKNAGGH
ncbi:hypothetical protein FGO68_gene1602 [Halteria grandinella]|uniref:Ubiquitin-like domain-containing protein n=1 Tax=Halteria grandinella TaxID=5974 RepID=A0A8J8NM82_HALGN|nr:hypothetical protein FGO68_gene1602 [Halteria grandinella]